VALNQLWFKRLILNCEGSKSAARCLEAPRRASRAVRPSPAHSPWSESWPINPPPKTSIPPKTFNHTLPTSTRTHTHLNRSHARSRRTPRHLANLATEKMVHHFLAVFDREVRFVIDGVRGESEIRWRERVWVCCAPPVAPLSQSVLDTLPLHPSGNALCDTTRSSRKGEPLRGATLKTLLHVAAGWRVPRRAPLSTPHPLDRLPRRPPAWPHGTQSARTVLTRLTRTPRSRWAARLRACGGSVGLPGGLARRRLAGLGRKKEGSTKQALGGGQGTPPAPPSAIWSHWKGQHSCFTQPHT